MIKGSALQLRNHCAREAAFLARNGAWMSAELIVNRMDMFGVQPTPEQRATIQRGKREPTPGRVSDDRWVPIILAGNRRLARILGEEDVEEVARLYLRWAKSERVLDRDYDDVL